MFTHNLRDVTNETKLILRVGRVACRDVSSLQVIEFGHCQNVENTWEDIEIWIKDVSEFKIIKQLCFGVYFRENFVGRVFLKDI